MSELFYANCVVPCILPLQTDEELSVSEQLQRIPINKCVEDGLRATSTTPHYLKTLDTVFCGAIWGVPHVLAYSPLLEGESKLSDDDWICEQMLNILQTDYLKLRRKTDPQSQQILTLRTLRDAWTPPDFALDEDIYTAWRTRYEKSMIENQLGGIALNRLARKM